MHQIVPSPPSQTSSAPSRATVTPTGRPQTSRKPQANSSILNSAGPAARRAEDHPRGVRDVWPDDV
jgi:hypothetical protein